MISRADREDYSEQEARLAEAKATLVKALEDLSQESRLAAKALGSKRPRANLVDGVTAEFRAVERAEESYELARYDLRTARGEDG